MGNAHYTIFEYTGTIWIAWVGMGGHRSLMMIMVWVWVQIRRKMLDSDAHPKPMRMGMGMGTQCRALPLTIEAPPSLPVAATAQLIGIFPCQLKFSSFSRGRDADEWPIAELFIGDSSSSSSCWFPCCCCCCTFKLRWGCLLEGNGDIIGRWWWWWGWERGMAEREWGGV